MADTPFERLQTALSDRYAIEREVGLYDSGEAGGFLYYVMPFIDGESLRDRLARERELPVTEAVRILRDVVDALAKAHGMGVVHRDIKPDNVMLSDRHALVTDQQPLVDRARAAVAALRGKIATPTERG